MTEQPEPDSLRQRIADAVQPILMDTLPKPIARARAQDVADAVLTVVQPAIDEAQQRAEKRGAQAARAAGIPEDSPWLEVLVATVKTRNGRDRLQKRAETAEAIIARVRDLVADMQGVTGARWWAEQLTTALTVSVPADGPEGDQR